MDGAIYCGTPEGAPEEWKTVVRGARVKYGCSRQSCEAAVARESTLVNEK